MTNQPQKNQYIDIATFQRILDHSSDEIFVLDKNQRIIYVNKNCERHYALKPSDVIGKHNVDFVVKGYWRPSAVTEIYKTKAPVTILQTTNTGTELITTAIPVLNHNNEVEYVVSTARPFHRNEAFKFDRTPSRLPASGDMIANSTEMQDLLRVAQKASEVDSTVLITGESGTGKGRLASYIHDSSPRSDQTFLTINCAAIPEELLESELFGYAPGAFTGANRQGKIGLIESAEGGTIFLDEIGELSLKTQAKLLQLVQDHVFIPIGQLRQKTANVRVIAATNRNLLHLIQQGQFREDLFYRLNVVELAVPPLRNRIDDLLPLIHLFINEFNQKYNKHLTISEASLEAMCQYDWPGNIRQLQNVIERAAIVSENIIQPTDLPTAILEASSWLNDGSAEPITVTESLFHSELSLDDAVLNVERELVTSSYQRHQSTRKVAKELKISQSRASRLIRKHFSD